VLIFPIACKSIACIRDGKSAKQIHQINIIHEHARHHQSLWQWGDSLPQFVIFHLQQWHAAGTEQQEEELGHAAVQ